MAHPIQLGPIQPNERQFCYFFIDFWMEFQKDGNYKCQQYGIDSMLSNLNKTYAKNIKVWQ